MAKEKKKVSKKKLIVSLAIAGVGVLVIAFFVICNVLALNHVITDEYGKKLKEIIEVVKENENTTYDDRIEKTTTSTETTISGEVQITEEWRIYYGNYGLSFKHYVKQKDVKTGKVTYTTSVSIEVRWVDTGFINVCSAVGTSCGYDVVSGHGPSASNTDRDSYVEEDAFIQYMRDGQVKTVPNYKGYFYDDDNEKVTYSEASFASGMTDYLKQFDDFLYNMTGAHLTMDEA